MTIDVSQPPEVLSSLAVDGSTADDVVALRGNVRHTATGPIGAAKCGGSAHPSSACRRQLVQVVRRGDQAPLPGDLGGPAQEELPEAPGVLHDPKHRFYGPFAQAVAAPPPAADG